jgi:DNA gyrase subunit A
MDVARPGQDLLVVTEAGYGKRTDVDEYRLTSRGDNRVLAMDIARDDTELFVVTENGYGKRTAIAEYPVKGRGTMGVKTITLTEKKGGLAGALIVREHHELVFISQNGMVQRTGVRGISKQGRPSQGVRVMNLRDDDVVSAVALVMETNTSAQVQSGLDDGGNGEVEGAEVEGGDGAQAPALEAPEVEPEASVMDPDDEDDADLDDEDLDEDVESDEDDLDGDDDDDE